MKRNRRIQTKNQRLPWLFSLAIWALVLQLFQPVSELQAFSSDGDGFPLCLTVELAGEDQNGDTAAQVYPSGKHDCECCFAAPEPGVVPFVPAFAPSGFDADNPGLAEVAPAGSRAGRNNPIRAPPAA